MHGGGMSHLRLHPLVPCFLTRVMTLWDVDLDESNALDVLAVRRFAFI
jgi:hypothetical protein